MKSAEEILNNKMPLAHFIDAVSSYSLRDLMLKVMEEYANQFKQQQDAIEFAEWLDDNEAMRIGNADAQQIEDVGKWWIPYKSKDIIKYMTTEELYQLFLKEKGKQS